MLCHRRSKPGRRRVALSLLVIVAVVLTANAVRADEDEPESSAYNAGFEAYAEALKYVDDRGMVYYAGLKRDQRNLDQYVRDIGSLKRSVYEKWDEPAKVAFWVNAYNALTLKVIIDNYPIKASFLRSISYPSNSIRQIPGVWKKVKFRVMGRNMTLDEIEHRVLRVEFNEPRIHMALVCAAMGCPPLRNEPYDGDRLSPQLDDQALKFLADADKFRIDRQADTVRISKIFDWFGEDFVKTYKPRTGFVGHDEQTAAPLNFISDHLSDQKAAYLRSRKYSVKFLDYDWALNERKTRP